MACVYIYGTVWEIIRGTRVLVLLTTEKVLPTNCYWWRKIIVQWVDATKL